jgi:hypothetical protein
VPWSVPEASSRTLGACPAAVIVEPSVRATCISWTGVASIKVPIFSSANRGETGQCPEELRKVRTH